MTITNTEDATVIESDDRLVLTLFVLHDQHCQAVRLEKVVGIFFGE